MRYHEASRQGLGLLLMPVFALLATPTRLPLFAGAVIAVAGGLFRMYASGFIAKNQELATDGPYSMVRHPLYTGNLLLLAGFTVASGTWWAYVVAAWFWWFYYPPAIDYEDRKLLRIFGPRCAEWQGTVPAVLPRSLRPRRGGTWSFRTSLRRNAEPVVFLYTLFWLGWIYRQL
jgi:protein-S-isoprenylcysteine O-methyltransferase Ste14